MVHSAQTIHLLCVKISTISKWTKGCSTWASSPRRTVGCVQNYFYIWRKGCTYLALTLTMSLNGPYTYFVSRLALSPNRPKRASTWASSPRRMVGCVQNYFYVSCKLCTYLALTLTMSLNGPKRDLTTPTSHRSSIGCVQNDFWAYGMFGKNNAPI
jgi:hypothetical protein